VKENIIIIICLSVVLGVGLLCLNKQSNQVIKNELELHNGNLEVSKIQYIKDKDKNICFAYLYYITFSSRTEKHITFTEIDCKKAGL